MTRILDLQRLRLVMTTTGVVFSVFAVLGALTLLEIREGQADLVAAQEALRVEQRTRERAVCASSVQSRATQVVFGEVLIIAASSDGDDGAGQEIETFRTLINDAVVGRHSPSCRGVITAAQYRRRVREHAREMLKDALRRR